jgi:hypothetical protein
MDPSCKLCTGTNLASLTFIEPLTVLSKDALSFHSGMFANNSIKVVEEKNRNPLSSIQRTVV